MGLRLIGAIAFFSLAAGCASGPAIHIDENGVSPPAANYSLLESNDPMTAPLVRSDLETAGWRVVERDPRWRIEVLRTRRGEHSGAFTATSRPETPDAWSIPPAPRRWWRSGGEERSVLIAVLNGETGERVAWARARTRRPSTEISDPRLASEAATALLSQDDPAPRGAK